MQILNRWSFLVDNLVSKTVSKLVKLSQIQSLFVQQKRPQNEEELEDEEKEDINEEGEKEEMKELTQLPSPTTPNNHHCLLVRSILFLWL